jgi:hypothetical protein
MNNNYSEVQSLPIGYSVSDNFSPTLRSVIHETRDNRVVLKSTCGTTIRYVSYAELDRMVWGV